MADIDNITDGIDLLKKKHHMCMHVFKCGLQTVPTSTIHFLKQNKTNIEFTGI